MSRSTISTSTHIILKYSRAYPKPSNTQTQSSEAASEWQHFTNPVLRVLLDIKKSATNDQLELVRLRVLWTMDPSPDAMDTDQREFVFEDIDLLSYSTVSTTSLNIQTSLPIKAVFRESIVGIRYLHPRVLSPGSTPFYRRFQMTFTSASAASQFVDAICPICPCKADQPTLAQPPPLHSRQPTISKLSTLQSQTMSNAGRPDLRHSSSSIIPAAPVVPNLARKKTYVNNAVSSSPSLHFSSDSMAPPSTLPGCKTNLSSVSVSDSTPSSDLPEPSSSACEMQLPASEQQPSSSNGGQDTDPIGPEFLESLKKTPALYNLSRSQLEDLVAQVVREDGFGKLLESLDSMWKIKGFLGQ